MPPEVDFGRSWGVPGRLLERPGTCQGPPGEAWGAPGSEKVTQNRPQAAQNRENRCQNAPKSASPADFGGNSDSQPIFDRFSSDFSSKSRPTSSCNSIAPCEKSLVEAAMREHGDIAFHSVKTSVPAMFAKKQFGGKARNIDRNPKRKRHRKATCAARVDETVSATISAPKSTKNPPKIDENRPKSDQNQTQVDFFDRLESLRARFSPPGVGAARSRRLGRPPSSELGSLGSPKVAFVCALVRARSRFPSALLR